MPNPRAAGANLKFEIRNLEWPQARYLSSVNPRSEGTSALAQV
jgi:hypothetical protein